MSIDYPRAWEIAQAAPIAKHDPKCSYAQTGGALLCDCDVVFQHPETLDEDVLYTASGKPFRVEAKS